MAGRSGGSAVSRLGRRPAGIDRTRPIAECRGSAGASPAGCWTWRQRCRRDVGAVGRPGRYGPRGRSPTRSRWTAHPSRAVASLLRGTSLLLAPGLRAAATASTSRRACATPRPARSRTRAAVGSAWPRDSKRDVVVVAGRRAPVPAALGRQPLRDQQRLTEGRRRGRRAAAASAAIADDLPCRLSFALRREGAAAGLGAGPRSAGVAVEAGADRGVPG